MAADKTRIERVNVKQSSRRMLDYVHGCITLTLTVIVYFYNCSVIADATIAQLFRIRDYNNNNMRNLMQCCCTRVFRKYDVIISCKQCNRPPDTAVVVGGCTYAKRCTHTTVNAIITIETIFVFPDYEFRLRIKFHFRHVSWQANKSRNVKVVWSNNENKNVEKINTLKYSDISGYIVCLQIQNTIKKDTNVSKTVPLSDIILCMKSVIHSMAM